MSETLERFVAAGPSPQRAVTRALLAVARRPRGKRLLRRLGPVDQAVNGMLAMGRYDEPSNSIPLGWDPGAVVARARAARR